MSELHAPAQAPQVTAAPPPYSTTDRPLRLWPGVVIIALQWLVIKSAAWFWPGTMIHFATMFWGPFLGALALLTWWLFASRLRWSKRLLVLLACAVTAGAAVAVRDPSFSGIGLFAFFMSALPVVATASILWLLVTVFMRWPVRRIGLLVVFVLTWGYFTLVRFEGTFGDMSAPMAWRWTPTAEDNFSKYQATAAKTAPPVESAGPLSLTNGDWPGFRGPKRDSRLTGFRMATDWDKNPPHPLWRHPVGYGWSSFAVVGTRLYTQEQRGAEEAVVCYDAASGAELWAHKDSTRFDEAIGGPGPRATPSFHEGKIYALGAAGRLNCLDAVTGRMQWTHDIVADSGAKVPTWGFAASPLIVQGVVTVFAGGPDKKSVLGYDAASGDLRWSGGEGLLSYASLHPAHLGGTEQVILASEDGLTAFDPAKGDILWRHNWPLEGGMARVTQPAIVDDTSVLVGTGFGMGTRRLKVKRDADNWTIGEGWTTRAIRPYFNDLVPHKDHLYGFDSEFFTCVSLNNGKSKWRERGYGSGQVLLVADQDLLLILSETGEAVLAEANPAAHKELGRFQALEGKTWNHPVIAHGMLFVRNGAEAACYQLKE